jgi:hypothetical protein
VRAPFGGRSPFSPAGEHPPDLPVWCVNRQENKAVQKKRSVKDIDRLAAEETAAFLRRASITYLECCVSLMMTHMGRDEIAAILEQEADMLRKLD